MKKQQFIILLTILFSFLFYIGMVVAISFKLSSLYNNLNLIVLLTCGLFLNLYCVIYVGFKYKSKPYRVVRKRRFFFCLLCMLILFLIADSIINKNFDIFVAICLFVFFVLLSCLYYVRVMFSKYDRINVNTFLSQINELITYVKNVKNYNIVLLDTPTHPNVGDAAIAIAEKNYLRKKLNIDDIIEVTASNLDHMERIYALFTNKKKLILVHGGGFLGDLWPEEENRFRRIVKSFKKFKIVVLPQTIYYDLTNESSKNYFEKSKELYNSHSDLTIFAREKKSYEFLKENYKNINVNLVPDIVTTFEYNNKKFKRKGILVCMRSDLEKTVKSEEQEQIIQIVKNKYPNEPIQYTDTVINKRIFPEDREEIVNLKLSEFAKSRLIMTDRLHGMIFAALTNTPCIALGNSSGKVKGVYDWIKENEYIFYLDKISEFDKVLNKIDLSKEYRYHIKEIDKYFEPLSKILKKEKNNGRK